MEVMGMKAIRYERVMWIKITGVPILAWDESNFSSIAGFFGKVLVNTFSFWNNNDISMVKVCILSAFQEKINDELVVNLDGVVYRVGVFEIEDEWTPFKPFWMADVSK
ncbi:unnamed protein product [Lactuca virosa]|uniref:DUF4283 domain-containing protein n=1 Tax=Lactuca virosa TaxID=75947 RepID=A0AAU9MHL0_9ASTR|nr:unnamed protein product [Lactuca virosa]